MKPLKLILVMVMVLGVCGCGYKIEIEKQVDYDEYKGLHWDMICRVSSFSGDYIFWEMRDVKKGDFLKTEKELRRLAKEAIRIYEEEVK